MQELLNSLTKSTELICVRTLSMELWIRITEVQHPNGGHPRRCIVFLFPNWNFSYTFNAIQHIHLHYVSRLWNAEMENSFLFQRPENHIRTKCIIIFHFIAFFCFPPAIENHTLFKIIYFALPLVPLVPSARWRGYKRDVRNII